MLTACLSRDFLIISPTYVSLSMRFTFSRNVDEVLRLVEAYQFTDKHGEVCPMVCVRACICP